MREIRLQCPQFSVDVTAKFGSIMSLYHFTAAGHLSHRHNFIPLKKNSGLGYKVNLRVSDRNCVQVVRVTKAEKLRTKIDSLSCSMAIIINIILIILKGGHQGDHNEDENSLVQ